VSYPESDVIAHHWSSLAAAEDDRKRRESSGEKVEPKQFMERKLKAYLLKPGAQAPHLPAERRGPDSLSNTRPAPVGTASTMIRPTVIGENLAEELATLKAEKNTLLENLHKSSGQKIELMYAVMLALLAFVLGYFL